MTKVFFSIVIASFSIVAPALAQSPMQRVGSALDAAREEQSVQVQSTMNFFVPTAGANGEEAEKLREKSRRSVYETAARECDLLKETLAKDCRLVSISSSIMAQRQFQTPQNDGFNVNGQMSFRIMLK